MVDEPHDVVKLLVARMESHPEEFKSDVNGRWYDVVTEITEYGNEADKAAMNAKLRDIRLGEAHEGMMDELCNGPERRRRQEEEAEYERQLILQKAMAQRNTMPTPSQYAQTAGTFTPGLRGTSATHTILDDYANTNRKGSLADTITQIGQMIRNKK
jgi:hypothetical protein